MPGDVSTAFIGEKWPARREGRRSRPPTTSAALGVNLSTTAAPTSVGRLSRAFLADDRLLPPPVLLPPLAAAPSAASSPSSLPPVTGGVLVVERRRLSTGSTPRPGVCSHDSRTGRCRSTEPTAAVGGRKVTERRRWAPASSAAAPSAA